jgi:hypothetical protein
MFYFAFLKNQAFDIREYYGLNDFFQKVCVIDEKSESVAEICLDKSIKSVIFLIFL